MNNMTIRQRLYAVFGLVIGIFVCVSIYAGYNFYQINNGAMRIATEHMNNMMSLSQASSSLSSYRQCEYAMASAPTLSGQVYAAQEMRNLGNQMDIVFDNIAGSMEGEKAEAFSTMRQKWDSYRKGDANLEQLAGANKAQEALLYVAQREQAYNDVNWELGIVTDSYKDFVQAEVNAASDRYEQAKITLAVSILIVLLLSVFMVGALGHSINHSVAYLIGIFQEVAKGDLTVPMESNTKDEFGVLVGACKDTVDNLRRLIRNIQDTAHQTATFAGQLTENASQSAQATQQVAESICKVAGSASQQGEAVGSSMSDINSMAEQLHIFQQKAESSSRAAGHMEEISRQGRSHIMAAVKQMTEISNSVTSSADVIRLLADRSNEIGQISDTISNIAGQTNLLALNAAIEAARAGEAGRGFAVVAEEVRKLAEESDKAAHQIAALISSIQQETQQAVKRMENGTEQVKNGQGVISAAGDAFGEIADAVDNLAHHAQDILQGAKLSADKAEVLVKVMENIHQASTEVASETQSVSAATEEQSASMDEVANASQKLHDLSNTLQDEAAKFKI